MPKRKPPQKWPGRTFDRSEIETIIDALASHQSRTSASFMGERLAIALLEQSPRQLTATLKKLALDKEQGEALIDAVSAAEESLRERSKLVSTAFARMCIASGAVEWPERWPEQAEGGAHAQA